MIKKCQSSALIAELKRQESLLMVISLLKRLKIFKITILRFLFCMLEWRKGENYDSFCEKRCSRNRPIDLSDSKRYGTAILKQTGEQKTLEILEEAITDPNYRYSYSRGIVEEIDGKVAGVAYGYTDEEESIIDQPLVPILEKYQLDASTRLFIDKETFPNEWYLDSISVSEDFRGQGIGSRLLEALPKLAKKANRSVIGLSVDEKIQRLKIIRTP